MKHYHTIDTPFDWKDILPLIDSQNIMLLNKADEDFVLAFGIDDKLILPSGTFNGNHCDLFLEQNKGEFIFGNLSYDIKNQETKSLTLKGSTTTDDLFFFVPQHVLLKKQGQFLYFGTNNGKAEVKRLLQKTKANKGKNNGQSLSLKPQTNKASYLQRIHQIKEKIQAGIIYEMNYCVNFMTNYNHFDATATYLRLNEIAQAPFSAFFKTDKQTVLSASPERFLKKKGVKLISQPIKGTAKRSEIPEIDNQIKQELKGNPKEIAENVMIVDLVRNDLSKISTKNSVKVEELCKLYTFNTVHQLISTVTGNLKSKTPFSTLIDALFPMGSMTGAPKISAMQNIHEFESFNRGIYSGTIGYIEPNGNFDFNVVIRTLVQNKIEKTVSSSVGGAITINSIPEKEYEECLIKLKAIEQTLC